MDILLGIIGYWLVPAIVTSLVLVRLAAINSGHTFHQEVRNEDHFPMLVLGSIWPFGMLIAAFLAMMILSARTRKTK